MKRCLIAVSLLLTLISNVQAGEADKLIDKQGLTLDRGSEPFLHENEIQISGDLQERSDKSAFLLRDTSGNQLKLVSAELEMADYLTTCSSSRCSFSGRLQLQNKPLEGVVFRVHSVNTAASGMSEFSIAELGEAVDAWRFSMTGYASYKFTYNEIILTSTEGKFGDGYLPVVLDALPEADRQNFIDACYDKCARVKVYGHFTNGLIMGDIALVAERIEAL